MFLKARLNEMEGAYEDRIETPDVIMTVQISQSLNYKLRVSFIKYH